jgi:hypothetical protein
VRDRLGRPVAFTVALQQVRGRSGGQGQQTLPYVIRDSPSQSRSLATLSDSRSAAPLVVAPSGRRPAVRNARDTAPG